MTLPNNAGDVTGGSGPIQGIATPEGGPSYYPGGSAPGINVQGGDIGVSPPSGNLNGNSSGGGGGGVTVDTSAVMAAGSQLAATVASLVAAVDALDPLFDGDAQTAPGNAEFQQNVGFSCRDTTKDLKLDDTFALVEFRWQQILRLGSGGAAWDEPEVKSPSGVITRPHPGQEGWATMAACQTVTDTNVDSTTGGAVARASLSEVGAAPVKTTLKQGYVINVQS